MLGVIAIFVYVGGEVAIGSLLVNFMADPGIGGLSEDVAGRYLSFYWGGAMVGRFIGAPSWGSCGRDACSLSTRPPRWCCWSSRCCSAGEMAMWSVLAIGLCNSIMFPTIFALALTGLGKHTGEGSGCSAWRSSAARSCR